MIRKLFLFFREWYFDLVAERYIDRYYIGYGDFIEIPGWIYNGRFIRRDP